MERSTRTEKTAAPAPHGKGHAAITRARAALVMDHPFFAAIVLRLRLKSDASCRDLWTDGRVLGFNPVYANALSEKKLVGALAHEVLHLALGHHARRRERDVTLWNRACDFAINPVLEEAGFSLPDGFARDPAYTGMSVDEIYTRLSLPDAGGNGLGSAGAGLPQASFAGRGDGERDKGREEDASDSEGGTASGRTDGDDDASEGAGTGKAVPRGGNKSGKNRDRAAFTGEVRDHPDLDDPANARARETAEQEADVLLNLAMRRALNMGSLPAGLRRLFKKSLPPRLDWRELLRRFLEDCADSDYSWTTPNRRHVHQGVYLPSRREPRIPHLVMAVDSSGSVDERALGMFCTELSSLLDDWDTTLTVLFHDTRVQERLTLGRDDFPLTLSPVGGGGTDYRPVCDYIEEQHLLPSCLVWFTDMQCDRFPQEPPYPVLWVSTDPSAETPPFGGMLSLMAEVSSRMFPTTDSDSK